MVVALHFQRGTHYEPGDERAMKRMPSNLRRPTRRRRAFLWFWAESCARRRPGVSLTHEFG